jgi:hypothetical protein
MPFKKILIFFLILPSVCLAANWIEIGSSETIAHYIDKSSIEKKKNLITYWMLTDYKDLQLTSTSKYLSIKTKNIINCSTHEIAMTYGVTAKEGMGKGEILDTTNLDGKFSPIIPDSIGEIEEKYLCK